MAEGTRGRVAGRQHTTGQARSQARPQSLSTSLDRSLDPPQNGTARSSPHLTASIPPPSPNGSSNSNIPSQGVLSTSEMNQSIPVTPIHPAARLQALNASPQPVFYPTVRNTSAPPSIPIPVVQQHNPANLVATEGQLQPPNIQALQATNNSADHDYRDEMYTLLLEQETRLAAQQQELMNTVHQQHMQALDRMGQHIQQLQVRQSQISPPQALNIPVIISLLAG